MISSEESMTTLATIEKIDGRNVWVSTHANNSCGNCSSKGACGSFDFIRPLIDSRVAKNQAVNVEERFHGSSTSLKIANTLNAKVGDQVMLQLAPRQLLKGSFLAYLLPLILLFVFALVGKILFNEPTSIILGFAGLFAGLYFVKQHLSHESVKDEFSPRMVHSYKLDNSVKN